MRISINLATRPFVELRPLFARLRLAMAALALLAVGLGVGLHFLNARVHAAEARMDALKAQTLAVQTERQTNEQRMQQPQNRAVLERSKFLNALFARKSFSWTSVLMDIEPVLPTGVQVTSIEPEISTEGEVRIRLRVSGERDRAVDFVRNLERSQRFLHPRLANETAQTQEQGKTLLVAQAGAAGAVPGGVEFNILSGYNPLSAEAHAATAKPKVQPKKDAAGPGKPTARKPTAKQSGAKKAAAPATPGTPATPLGTTNKGGAR